MSKITNKQKISKFTDTLIKNILKDKPFTITLDKQSYYINRENLEKINKAINIKDGGSLTQSKNEIANNFLTEYESKKGNGLHEGGFVFTIPAIIAAVTGGLAAAGGITGGVSSAVKAANDAKANEQRLAEQKRHNELIESKLAGTHNYDVKLGKGIFLKPYKGESLQTVLTPIISKLDKIGEDGKEAISKTVSTLTPFFKIFATKEGKGIYLKPKKF